LGRAIWSIERTGIVYDNAGRELSETTISYRQEYPGGPHATFTTNIANSYTGGLLTQQYQDAWKNGSDSSAPDSKQTYSYAWWDGALQSGIVNDHDDDTGTAAWTTGYSFDASGHIVTAAIADGRARQVHLAVDQNGMIASRDEELNTAGEDPGPRQLRYHYAGIQIGEAGNNGTDNLEYMASIRDRLTPAPSSPGLFRNGATGATPFADFEQSYEAINGLGTASTGQSYTVEGGESLQQVALQLWGDASLWYLIADTNGLTGAEPLAAGQLLAIPNKVRNARNSADTWRPYDPNEALGDTSPGEAKPRKKGKCGAFGQVLTMVVALAASWLFGSVPGSMLSQKFQQLMNQRDSFSWNEVGIAAVASVVDANNLLRDIPVIGDVYANMYTQGVSKLLGLRKDFSWTEVATTAVISAVASIPKLAGIDPSLGVKIATQAAATFAGAATRSLLTGTSFGDNIVAVLPQVVASTLGDELIGLIGKELGAEGFSWDGFLGLERVGLPGFLKGGLDAVRGVTAFGSSTMRQAVVHELGQHEVTQTGRPGRSTTGTTLLDGWTGAGNKSYLGSGAALSNAHHRPAETAGDANEIVVIGKPSASDVPWTEIELEGAGAHRFLRRTIFGTTDVVDRRFVSRNQDRIFEMTIVTNASWRFAERRIIFGDTPYYQIKNLDSGEIVVDEQLTPHFNETFYATQGFDPEMAWLARKLTVSVEAVGNDGTHGWREYHQSSDPEIANYGQKLLDQDKLNPGSVDRNFYRSWKGDIKAATRLKADLDDFDFYANVALNLMMAPTIFYGPTGAGYGVSRSSLSTVIPRGLAAETGPVRTNFNVYEILSQQPITGTSRSAHRASANRALYKDLQANPELVQMLNRELGSDVLAHMSSGKALLNPTGAVWHHPIESPGVMRLLRTSEHNRPLLQPVLHPGPNRTGGFGTHFGGN
jgi:hypothetical protein